MSKFKEKYLLLSLTFFLATSCGGNGDNKKQYPAELTQNFMNACTLNGGEQEMCSCLLEKIQEKYTLEEYSAIETKIQFGKTPDEFLEFLGKARVQCSKKN